jgi:predicted TPR repeat methyltransferase
MNYIWDISNKGTYNNRVGHYKYNKEFNFIINQGAGLFKHILDVAGGSGRFAIPLTTYSDNITVIDINQEAVTLLKNRNNAIKTIHADFLQVNQDQKYTLITCIEAIGYFPDLERFFLKIAESLDENGRFIFSCTNPLSWRFLFRKIKHLKNKPTSYNEPTLKDLECILNKAGLKIVAKDGFNWLPLPLSSNSIFVPFFALIEKAFKLNKYYAQSPWLMISVKKKLIK